MFPAATFIATIALGASVGNPCEYCTPVSGTISHGATAIGFKAAGSIYDLPYEWWLNNSCELQPIERYKCPKPLKSGSFRFGLASTWFIPQTSTFVFWAIRNKHRCSANYTATIPVYINVMCKKYK